MSAGLKKNLQDYDLICGVEEVIPHRLSSTSNTGMVIYSSKQHSQLTLAICANSDSDDDLPVHNSFATLMD